MWSRAQLKSNLKKILQKTAERISIFKSDLNRKLSEFYVRSAKYNPASRSFQIMTRSLRYSVAAWYGLGLSVVIIVFGISLYCVYSDGVERQSDTALVSKSEEIHRSIYSFWKADSEFQSVGKGNWYGSPAESIDVLIKQKKFSDLIRKWKEKTGFQNIPPFRISDKNGKAIYEDEIFRDLNQTLFSHKFKKGFSDITFFGFESGGIRYRRAVYPVLEDGKVVYYIEIAKSQEWENASKRQFITGLVLLTSTMMLALYALGWVLISRAMIPIDRMTRQVRMISDHRLGRRLDVPPTGDELERLAVTFNELLDHIEESFERLRKFSAAASHELKTPLTAMKGDLEVILKRTRSAEEYKTTLQGQLEGVEQMIYMVKELLNLAKAEAIDGVVENESLDFGSILSKIRHDWSQLARSKGVQLDITATRGCRVKGDRNLLERLTVNLIDNAIKYTPQGGGVAVNLVRLEDEICLTVRDSGSGISEEDIPHIFTKFFHKEQSPAEVDSSGLGLGLCQWIAQIHEGRIEVSSAPIKGTVFTVWLPIDGSSG